MFAENVAAYGEEQANSETGQSEHQTGLHGCDPEAMDQESFADTVEGQWIADNAQNYGFIIRFPDERPILPVIL